MVKITLLFIFVLTFTCLSDTLQTTDSRLSAISFLSSHKNIKTINHTPCHTKSFDNFRFAGHFAISFYQQVISSQYAHQCCFTPSCSKFGQEAISKCGLFLGSLMIADRLARCNGINPHRYSLDVKTGRNFDPVDSEILWP